MVKQNLFYIGKQCPKCGNGKRYKSSRNCVCCTLKKNKDEVVKLRKAKWARDRRLRLTKEERAKEMERANKLMKKGRYWNTKTAREKRKEINSRIKNNLRRRLWRALQQQKTQKSESTFKLVGCSVFALKQHFQELFKTGMSWRNYGEWEIDHVIPCYHFNLKEIEQQRTCFHYSNLQPLWKYENRIKNKFGG